MINTHDILETINMIQEENLDIRTITMGISLLDCADSDIDRACDKIYDKICKRAENLVKTGENIEREYGIPIINKRISVTPIAMVSAASGGDPVKYAKVLDKAAKEVGVNFLGGYSALVQKGFAAGDERLIRSIPEALAVTDRICSSVNIGSTKAGINMDAVRLMGQIVKASAERTIDKGLVGPSKLVIFCNAPDDNPFMAGAFHGAGEPDSVINVGVSGPGVVRAALSKIPDADITEVADTVKKTAFKITRVGQLVAKVASERLNVPFGIVDLSLAPTPAVGDSVMASSHVGGLSGAFIPVSEDAGMIDAARSKVLSIEKLEAMTAVCSVGLDMIAIPGDTSAEVISAIIADEAAIGMVNSKTTAVRVIPAIGKKDGDEVEFGGLFGVSPIMKVSTASPAKFISRGGRIPAPLQSLKN